MIVQILQLICGLNIFFSIIVLSYICTNKIMFDDWRRVFIMVYSVLLIVALILFMIWIGRMSYRLVIYLPTGGFLFFFFPILLAILTSIFFVHRKEGAYLEMGEEARDYMIGCAAITIFISICFLLGSIAFRAQTLAVVEMLENVDTIVQLFDRLVESNSTHKESSSSPRSRSAGSSATRQHINKTTATTTTTRTTTPPLPPGRPASRRVRFSEMVKSNES